MKSASDPDGPPPVAASMRRSRQRTDYLRHPYGTRRRFRHAPNRSVSWLHEGETAKALDAIAEERAVAEEIEDLGSAAADLTAKGTILLETGSPTEAEVSYTEALATLEKANVPASVKEIARRTRVYQAALVALARGDLAAARDATSRYGKLVEGKGTAFEVKQQHELEGRVALAAGDAATAVRELRAANDQDPRVLYHLGLALELHSDRTAAAAMLRKAAEFNALALNFPLVRKAARDRLAAFAAVTEGAKVGAGASTVVNPALR